MRFFRFILGLGFTFMAGLSIWGLYTFIEESSNISDDILYIFLFLGVALMLGFAAICSFKQSLANDTGVINDDMALKDMLIQKEKTNKNTVSQNTVKTESTEELTK